MEGFQKLYLEEHLPQINDSLLLLLRKVFDEENLPLTLKERILNARMANSNLDLSEIQQLWTSGYNLSGYYDVVRTLIAKSMDGHRAELRTFLGAIKLEGLSVLYSSDALGTSSNDFILSFVVYMVRNLPNILQRQKILRMNIRFFVFLIS